MLLRRLGGQVVRRRSRKPKIRGSIPRRAFLYCYLFNVNYSTGMCQYNRFNFICLARLSIIISIRRPSRTTSTYLCRRSKIIYRGLQDIFFSDLYVFIKHFKDPISDLPWKKINYIEYMTYMIYIHRRPTIEIYAAYISIVG